MPFKTILKELTTTMDAQGAIMLDWEGEAVDSFSSEETLELDAIGAHKGIILNLIQQAGKRVQRMGEINTIGITTEKARIAISVLKDGYYILLIMDKAHKKFMGKAFMESKKAAKKLMAEM
ncbi:MAG: hypothetical protein KAT46_02890 [Deltaproteobacteria bacterium]|nr:hypothetical protein [Deltaproteobacteria bacterium]